MTNLMDYLTWRGDLSMKADPFNIVDAMILAELSYLPLEHLIPEAFGLGRPIAELAKEFQPDTVPESERIFTFREDYRLLRKLAQSERFRNVRMMGSQAITDSAQEVQFAAFTYVLPAGEYYIAFRGTDSSITGWKEDFSFSYLNETTGQRFAAEYLNRHVGASHDLIVGGHSKGGNFAVYAAVNCMPVVKKLIRRVYSFDGPGFRDEFAHSDSYQEMLPKCISVIPQSSLVGQILTSDTPHRIVRSSAPAILQHFMYSWAVQGNDLVYAESLSRLGTMINVTLRQWLASLDDESRRSLTEAIFDVMSAPETDTFKALRQNKIQSVQKIYAAIKSLDPDTQFMVRKVIRKLISSSGNALNNEIYRFCRKEEQDYKIRMRRHKD